MVIGKESMLWPWKVIRKQPARVGFTISLSFGSRKAQCVGCIELRFLT